MSVFPYGFVGFPILLSFVCSSHGGRLSQVCKSKAGSSTNRSWSPNPRQVTEDDPRGPAAMLSLAASCCYSHRTFRLRTTKYTGPVPAFWERSAPLARHSSHSCAIVDVHTLSAETMTLRCQLLLLNTPHLVDKSGSQCRKWSVSTQHSTDKRKCAACCGQQFSHGEARICNTGPIEIPQTCPRTCSMCQWWSCP